MQAHLFEHYLQQSCKNESKWIARINATFQQERVIYKNKILNACGFGEKYFYPSRECYKMMLINIEAK